MTFNNYKAKLESIHTFIFDIDGVLTDGTVLVNTNGDLLRRMNVRDGYALKTAIDHGLRIAIISGGSNEGVAHRLRGLGVEEVFLGVSDKMAVLNQLAHRFNITLEDVLYMGDDLPDYQVMQAVGFPCCPQDAAPEIKSFCHYISDRKGGEGAVRDVLEQALKVKGLWMKSFDADYD